MEEETCRGPHYPIFLLVEMVKKKALGRRKKARVLCSLPWMREKGGPADERPHRIVSVRGGGGRQGESGTAGCWSWAWEGLKEHGPGHRSDYKKEAAVEEPIRGEGRAPSRLRK